MARDYKDAGNSAKAKPAAKKRPSAVASKPAPAAPTKSGMSPVLAMAIGLGIGLAIAIYVYIMLQPKTEAKAVKVPEVVVNKTEPAPVIEEEGSRFDFYSILPKLEVIIPEQEIYQGDSKGAVTGEKAKIKPIKQPGSYILQAGSFKSAPDAERVRAELALLGVESHIETVTINKSDTWHRVRIGPFTNNRKLDKIRNRLLDNGIDVMVLKVKT